VRGCGYFADGPSNMSKRTKPAKLQRISAAEISEQEAPTHVRANATVYTLDTGKATVRTAHFVSTLVTTESSTPKPLPPTKNHQCAEDSQELYDEDQGQYINDSTHYNSASNSGKRKHTTGVRFVF
jgi:hypothetical protein